MFVAVVICVTARINIRIPMSVWMEVCRMFVVIVNPEIRLVVSLVVALTYIDLKLPSLWLYTNVVRIELLYLVQSAWETCLMGLTTTCLGCYHEVILSKL